MRNVHIKLIFRHEPALPTSGSTHTTRRFRAIIAPVAATQTTALVMTTQRIALAMSKPLWTIATQTTTTQMTIMRCSTLHHQKHVNV